ncbi:uncharacterized protein LOC105697601 [Orussus abietinus]|uniref:uncharacterized protein LOC105697601 n=1 Tax=Orussus abietinus TaxID=222816 RepID=UPI000626625E|nr:uncharacterized protein LOC105697601 [Orussus abietinus]
MGFFSSFEHNYRSESRSDRITSGGANGCPGSSWRSGPGRQTAVPGPSRKWVVEKRRSFPGNRDEMLKFWGSLDPEAHETHAGRSARGGYRQLSGSNCHRRGTNGHLRNCQTAAGSLDHFPLSLRNGALVLAASGPLAGGLRRTLLTGDRDLWISISDLIGSRIWDQGVARIDGSTDEIFAPYSGLQKYDCFRSFHRLEATFSDGFTFKLHQTISERFGPVGRLLLAL